MIFDLLILSNGPGEITTWVRPVVKALRQIWPNDAENLRISVILSPCPNATGKEAVIANSYPEINRVQGCENFFSTLLWGKTAENWEWSSQGVVLFLGGDQAFSVIIGKRLGYKIVTYAEWDARWYRWVDSFGVRNEAVKNKVPKAYQHKCEVIGDLMTDVPYLSSEKPLENPIIGFMPGSKPNKLIQGVPFLLSITDILAKQAPHLDFIVPLAPTLTLQGLANYADPKYNVIIEKTGWQSGILAQEKETFYLKTSNNTKIKLITDYPAYESLCRCSIVLTTVGANTAELGALGIPMIVLLPTQQLDAMKSWDGIGGIVTRVPLLGSAIAKIINGIIIKQGKLFAWPNIWAKREIVPELVGELTPEFVAQKVLNYLGNPEQLKEISDNLQEVRGETGASMRLARLIQSVLI
ncbi:MAG: lipid-A-disaccharide synthase [Microcystaceae cyanobacterium]